jgi:uncharacterized protein (TIGR03643 family)
MDTSKIEKSGEMTQPALDLIPAGEFNLVDTDRIIEMAWEDRTPFDAIEFQFGLKEAEVKAFMKKNLKTGSYRLWRTRVENCKTKHGKRRIEGIDRFKCNLQRNISMNKISKRK